MMCMIETINELEKSKKKGASIKGGSKKKEVKPFYPKKLVVGNKKDLRKNKAAGTIDNNDIQQLGPIKIMLTSALTN
jgi:hypothetical protein